MTIEGLLEQLTSLLMSPPVLLIIVALLLFLGRKVISSVSGLFLTFLSVFLSALSIFAAVLWFPASVVARRLFPKTPAQLARRLESLGAARGNLLCAGKREAVARAWWSESDFPFLYRPVPPDILRPLHEDGKLVGGVSITWLADRHMTEQALISSIGAGLVVGIVILIPAIIHLAVIVGTTATQFSSDFSLTAPTVEQWPGHTPTLAPQSWASSAAISDVGPVAKFFIIRIITVAISWILLAVGGAILGTFTALKAWQWEKGLPYTLITKDADVRWGGRIETRNISNAVYKKQIALSEDFLKDTPLFKLGTATGVARLRGDLAGPVEGQVMCLDGESLFQHLLVLGGTGEGKTSAILKPLMRQLMAHASHGFYVTDAKGVLWRDALNVARAVGREGAVSVIGTGADQFGVDPIAKLTPTQVAATLRSVLKQMGGGSNDSFWPDMAANILRHVLTIALTYKLTDAGQKEERGGLNPYSLWWAYQAVLNKEQLALVIGQIKALGEANDAEISRLIDAGERDPSREKEIEAEIDRLTTMISPETHASLLYLETTWAGMAPETKSGIVANVTQLLDGFAGARVLRERFACGRSDSSTIELTRALNGGIVLNALSSIEDGMPARLVLIMLKTTLYREARVREADFKKMEPKRDPQKAPCVVIMDEVQEIATSDPASGLSDATFWNVARTTGLAGIFATQTLAALNQALGEEAAANFIQQARSKVFFRSEDAATVEHACWCAGEFERNLVYEDGQRESIYHRRLLDGWDPFAPVNEAERVRGGSQLFRSVAAAARSPTGAALQHTKRRNVYEPDFRFVAALPPPLKDENSTVITAIQMMQGASWRAEDLEREYRSKGNELRPALTSTDIINMGRWHAFAHIQRAGAVRQDIISVEHDHA
jgi:hypothetical protein